MKIEGKRFARGAVATPHYLASAVGLGLSPALWIFATEGRLWPLAIDAAICGVSNAGLSLATFSLPLAISRRTTSTCWLEPRTRPMPALLLSILPLSSLR